MKIAICDDDSKMQQIITKLLKLAYDEAGRIWIEPVCFSNAEELLKQYQQGVRFDLLYLDIEMPGLSGMEAASRIRITDRQVQFIFVTSHEQYVYDAFDVQPVAYLSKPIDCQRFQKAFNNALENYRLHHQTIACESEGGLKILPVTDIVMAESAGKIVKIYMADGAVHEVNHSLNEMEQQLKLYHIVRCHRSYLVHLAYVREINIRKGFIEGPRSNGKEVLLYKPAEIPQIQHVPIGQKYKAEFLEALMKYQQEGGWIRK